MPETILALQQAITVVRAQIPRGELTRASVEHLLQAAEAVCAEAIRPEATQTRTLPRQNKRQEARRRWAKIAQENAREVPGDV